ncbi:TetR/AcrR family transcriptional regulator [Subtercola lobariae]|uniref:TetR family transcriptional regulator n=1 Tax=Subtercola lobariae TaxID=1588641 RepID=A0A917EZZ0_9MICO|nr:TetR/AcrR family transcriptional regulator [Subtercola lobariae]GGF28942.1 TetR family transcriptional regulator [Subtercola lobariae]
MATPTTSRRERPAKRALSREWIIAETIEIMRAEGLEKATMRRVAQALDTGPASLYVYIANTAALHSAVLDELLGTLSAANATEGDCNERLEALLRQYANILFAYPGLARSALLIRPTGANAVLLYDRVLGLLLEGGVAVDRAAWGVDLLLQYVTANAAEHSIPSPSDIDAPRDDDDMGILAQALRSADPATSPHIAAHVDAVLSGSPAERVTWAIQALIAGIAATPIPSHR